MPILFCSLDIHLPYCHSLKEKRRVIKSAASRLRARFNMAVSEIDYQDTWQRCRLGAVTVGPDPVVLQQVSQRFIRESERILGGDLVDHEIEIFEHDD